jgi:hypothetical protein
LLVVNSCVTSDTPPADGGTRSHSGSESDASASSEEQSSEQPSNQENEGISSDQEGNDHETVSDDDLYARRLEDLSEEDFDPGEAAQLEAPSAPEDDDYEEKQAALSLQLRNWVEASKERLLPGKPVKCVLCGGALILNGTVLRQHVESKKHRKNEAAVAADGHADLDLARIMCFAEDYIASDSEGDDQTETHYERAMRVEQALQRMKEASKEQEAVTEQQKNAKRKKARKYKSGKKEESHDRPKRPGKRQRAALRAEGVGHANKKDRKAGA